jgi:hypothetical protein
VGIPVAQFNFSVIMGSCDRLNQNYREELSLRSFTRKHSLVLLWATGLLLCTSQAAAQSTGTSGTPPKEEKKEERGVTLYEAFEGSTNTDGQAMDLNTTAGYIFNRHFSWDAGLPVFFLNGTSTTGSKVSSNGIGDVYTDFRFTTNNTAIHYVTALSGSAPTGDSSKGRSTGRATVNWGNSFSREFGKWTPFANVNLGNSLYNTTYFRRPFLTLGPVATFEAGPAYDLGHSFSVSASAYDVAPWGTQKVFSRIIGRSGVGGPGRPGGLVRRGRVFETAAETTGGASLVRDNGFNAALDFNPAPTIDFEVAYSHSVHYQLDTFSFGVGVNLSRLVSGRRY